MSFTEHLFSDWELYELEVMIDDWFFVFALFVFAVELIRLAFQKKLSWNTAGDSVANFVSLAAHLGIIAVIAGAYGAAFYLIYPDYSLTLLPSNYWTVALCILLADLVYYWEHRLAHVMGIGWATHTVHHSSPYFNISVAYRHGPLDAIYGLPFHLLLVFIGFDPFLVLFSAAMVQLYQTLLHTEMVDKLPKMIEAIFNTPSHHRVHHGSNPQYLDKNYGGILIIWDKMFGTFEAEEEKVVFGVLPPIDSVNPLVVFFHGLHRLYLKIKTTRGIGNKLLCLVLKPGWEPSKKKASPSLEDRR